MDPSIYTQIKRHTEYSTKTTGTAGGRAFLRTSLLFD